MIERWQGQRLAEPCLIQDCPFLKISSVKDTGVQGIIREFARAYGRKSENFTLRKKYIEDFLLKNQNCQYSLYKRTYKSLKILRGTETPQLEIISTFHLAGQP